MDLWWGGVLETIRLKQKDIIRNLINIQIKRNEYLKGSTVYDN